MKSRLNTIVLVDDDGISNFVTQETLRELALSQEVVTLTDGQSALGFLQQHLPQRAEARPETLVLLDLNMPRMDGFEFMEALQAAGLEQQVVVAMLTSSTSERDVSQAKKWGIAGFLQKPVSGSEVKTLVVNHFAS